MAKSCPLRLRRLRRRCEQRQWRGEHQNGTTEVQKETNLTLPESSKG